MDDILRGLSDFLTWMDQRINVNEGVIALVALLVGVGLQNAAGARRIASWGFIAIAVVLAGVAIIDPARRIYGVDDFEVEIPSIFHNIHGVSTGAYVDEIASDAGGRNSVRLISGTLRDQPGPDYLRDRCSGDLATLAKRNEVDDVTSIVLSDPPYRGSNWCYFSWHVKLQPLDHYEVFVVKPDGAEWRFAFLRLRIEKPSHVLVTDDYCRMRNSLLTSADIAIPRGLECRG